MAGIDLSQLSGLQPLVKSHSISDTEEKTTFRSAKDIKEMDDLIAQKEIGCDPVRKGNVFNNVLGYTTERTHYQSNC